MPMQLGRGFAQAGELHLLAGPRRAFRADMAPAPLCIYLHGNLGTPETHVQDLYEMPLIRRISRKYGVLASLWGGDLNANDTAIARVAAGITAARTSAKFNVDEQPVLLLGMSAGFGLAAAYAHANPTQVRALGGVIPATDLGYAWQNNVPSGSTAAINASYGGTYSPTTHGPTHDPMLFASTLLPGKNVRIWTSSNDPTCPPATATAFVAVRPATVRTNVGAKAHSTASISGYEAEIADWCIAQA